MMGNDISAGGDAHTEKKMLIPDAHLQLRTRTPHGSTALQQKASSLSRQTTSGLNVIETTLFTTV